MAHSPELIAMIMGILERDYPPSAFKYSIEKAIPGTRMFPDIAIMPAKSRNIICVVEIGYTRPEKLTAYRHKLSIPDVRWYDKRGNLHTRALDQQTVVEKITLEPAGMFSVYLVEGQVECRSDDCMELEDELLEDVGEDDERRRNDIFSARRCSVLTAVITDWNHAWLPSYCDKCGENFHPVDADEEAFWIINDLECLSPRQFGLQHGRRLAHVGWTDALELARKQVYYWSDPIEYLDGIRLADAPDLKRFAVARIVR